MIRRSCCAMLCVCVMVLTGCASEASTHSEADENINIVKNISADDVSYVRDTDDQPNIMQTVYTDDGVYTMDYADNCDGSILTFYDYKTKQTVPVCNKLNCNHDDENCNAIFMDNIYPTMLKISYYQGEIYVLKAESGYLYLERVALDGSTREKSCTLTRVETQTGEEEDGMTYISTYYPEWIIHRGYVYYATAYPGNTHPQLLRVKLDSSQEPEILYTRENDFPDLYRISGFGNGVYFQAGNYANEDLMSLDAQLYVYDIESEEVSLVAEDVIRQYTVGENVVYYFDMDDNIAKYDILTKERTVFCETEKGDWGSDYTIFLANDELYYIFIGYDDDMNKYRHEYEYSLDGKLLSTYDDNNLINPY